MRTFMMKPGYSRSGVLDIVAHACSQQMPVIHTHGYRGDILMASVTSRQRPALIATVHGWTASRRYSRMWLYESLDGLALRRFDKVVAVSSRLGTHPRLRTLPPGRLEVIHNGIELSSANDCEGPRDDASMDPSIVEFCGRGVVIGSIGRLVAEKAQHLLLQALAELRQRGVDARLLLLGEGRLREDLNNQVASLGMQEHVCMPGYRADAARYLQLVRVFALSSITEGLPIVVLEAMKANIPIVSSAVGGITEILQDGSSAVLFDSGSAPQLTLALERVLTNPSLASGLVAKAGERLASAFSSPAMSEAYRRAYEVAVANRQRVSG